MTLGESEARAGGEWLREVHDQARHRSAVAAATYDALIKTGKLGSHLLLTYRCPQRCALLHVLRVPQGMIFGWPRYKTSRSATERTANADGRRINTEDGDRHWKAHAGFAEDAFNVPINCDHLTAVLEKDEIQHDLDERRAEVTLPRNARRAR